MPRRAVDKSISLQELGGLLKDGLNRAVNRPTVHGYKPHAKQIAFHSSQDQGRLYIGGNRSGKTVGGVIEDIYYLRGQHPYRRVPQPPVRGRIVTVSYTEGIEMIIIPELTKWIPPSELINGSWEDSYNKQLRQLTLANGSTCELMSYDQKLEKFAGTSRHFIHFDEEPPKAIFTECKARLVDTAGSWWITMTPVEGMTWVYDELYLKGLSRGHGIAVIIVDMTENPYISNAEIENFLSDLDDNDRKARGAGKFVQIGGLVFKTFDYEKHVIEAGILPPLDWTHYASMDHGFNNPTAWCWHAVSPKGSVVTYDELYANETLIESFAQEIHLRNSQEGRRAPDIYVGDPAIAQRNAETGHSIQTAYSLQGIPIALGNNDVKIGVERMNAYLYHGKWAITANCGNLIRQLQRVRWKTYETAKKRHDNNPREEIHKKDDHAVDGGRYFFSMMPELYIPETAIRDEVQASNKIVKEVLQAVTPMPWNQYTDVNLAASLQHSNRTEWTNIDEYMGGIW